MKVHLPTQLHSYTRGAVVVESPGATLADLMRDLDRRYPGIRFRVIDEQDAIRPHIRFFVNYEQAFDLNAPLKVSDEVRIVGALSGG
ncbi:MAG: MoaD/ThiS family protein [Chloroflexi bacterium]|nr:MoaD/ThiS family protein [Chloroflexota bacterium]